jgi:hypothetical protein
MNTLDPMQKSILLEGLRDHMSAWELAREARTELGAVATATAVRRRVFGWVSPLVEAGFLAVGELVPSGEQSSRFVPWSGDSSANLRRAENEWARLDRDPSIGEICWFHNTAQGDSVARGLRHGR